MLLGETIMKRPAICELWKHRVYFTSMEAAIKFMGECDKMLASFPVFAYYCQGGAVVVWD